MESVKNMPEEKFEDMDVLLERLIMLDKIQIGIEQADRGDVISLEELCEEMKKW